MLHSEFRANLGSMRQCFREAGEGEREERFRSEEI